MLKLKDKNDYVNDGEMLDWYLASGLKLEVITVKQKLDYSKREWFKPLIEFNIQKRKEAKMKVINLEMYSLNWWIMPSIEKQ